MDRLTSPTIVRAQPEVELTGRAIAPGLGMGQAWVVGDVLKGSGAPEAIGQEGVENELVRLKQAFEETLAELEKTAQRIEFEFDAALAAVFRAHGMLLRDLSASGEFQREIGTSLLTAETAVRRVFNRWYQRFEALENQTLRERADDVLDLGRNIIRRLRGVEDAGRQFIPEHSILVVERLLPSDVVRLPKSQVTAVVVESLGQGSHAALLVREKGIPTITELPGILGRVTNGTELLVDGYRGSLVIAPQPATRATFQERLEKWRATLVRCKGACRQPARSLDGQLIRVEANIGIQDDVQLALENGADGIGLLRIEQLYFARNTPPSESELFTDLKQLVTPLRDKPVTIRLLDIGGDKPLPFLRLPPTSNPVLGRRGVRVLLEYAQLVRTQMRAILRLSQEHPVRMLIPMVTLEEDIQKMREVFDALSVERKFSHPPEFGAMVETPAAALSIPALLRHVDFFCVGTNDLTQYTLAAARDDAAVNDYYLDSHASVLRLLSIILADAKERSVTLCGELAGRESWVPRLLQMGFRTLSVAPTVIPTTKATIRGVDIGARWINNAGIDRMASFVETTEEAFDSLMNVHLKGVFFLTQTLLPLLADGGRIVNISSGLARFSVPGYSAYGAMKGAVEVLTRYLAKELGPRRIGVNVVAPGIIETDFTRGVLSQPGAKDFMASNIALGRVGVPDDIGGVVAFLCSEAGRWVNGQRLEASGGMFL